MGRATRRADFQQNRSQLLETAARTFRDVGVRVPMAEIARRSGVGVGTLYRHFPDRERLLVALELHSYELILGLARAAAARRGGCGRAALREYLEGVIAARDRLFLPLHGGSLSRDEPAAGLRAAVGESIEEILQRGRADATIRTDATPMDVVIGGTFLCVPLPHAADWDAIAERQLELFLDGMAPPRRPV